MSNDARKVLDQLVQQCPVRWIVGDPDCSRIARLVQNGETIPDHLLPGRMIMRLPEDERAQLCQLTSEDASKYRHVRTFGDDR